MWSRADRSVDIANFDTFFKVKKNRESQNTSKKVSTKFAEAAASAASKSATALSLAEQIAQHRAKINFQLKVVDAPVANTTKQLNDSNWKKYDRMLKRSFAHMTQREKKKIIRGPKKKGKRPKACKG